MLFLTSSDVNESRDVCFQKTVSQGDNVDKAREGARTETHCTGQTLLHHKTNSPYQLDSKPFALGGRRSPRGVWLAESFWEPRIYSSDNDCSPVLPGQDSWLHFPASFFSMLYSFESPIREGLPGYSHCAFGVHDRVGLRLPYPLL